MNLPNSVYRRFYEGLNFRLRTFAGGRYANSCRPTSIVILLTERCNARCIHCDIWKNRGQEDSPTLEEWKTVLHDLRRWLGPVQVVLSGGEALLKTYALELIEYGSAIGLFIELLSHGYWKDQTKFERLAFARPGRVTFSCDGIGEVHNLVRGRDKFFNRTEESIQTLRRMRQQHALDFKIRLKTVVMQQNLQELRKIAEYAQINQLEVFYQPIEQNYNTPENPEWFMSSPLWPNDVSQAIRAVEQLKELKKQGLPIVNSLDQLDAMRAYFGDPAGLRVATQSHAAHERELLCSALTMLQIQSNGDVTVCTSYPVVGNIRTNTIRSIWENRPHLWEQGCCLESRQAQSTLVQIEKVS
jgi:MoaA/NifB/PqqE/SkfB family radical SAM enzyme